MPSKQLEIVVKARDEANATFSAVGEGAHRLGDSLRSVSETGHELHQTMRGMEHAFVAFEVAPIGVDALSAAWKTLTGTAEDGAEAQRHLYDSLKELPVVGSKVAAVAEYLGDSMAHAFGKETTSEVEAGIAAQKKAMADLSEELPKIAAGYHTAMSAVAALGQDAGGQEIEKARAKFRDEQEKLRDEKRKIVLGMPGLNDDEVAKKAELDYRQGDYDYKKKNAGAYSEKDLFDSGEELGKAKEAHRNALTAKNEANAAMKSLDDEQIAAAKTRDDEIAKGQLKRVQTDREFYRSLVESEEKNHQQLAAIASATLSIGLESDNQAYAAKLANLEASLAQEIEAIREGSRQKLAELQKAAETQQLLADQGNKDAAGKAAKLKEAMGQESADAQGRIAGATGKSNATAALEQQNELRRASLEILRSEADAGNAVARLQADRLELSRKQEATEKALQAIAGDATTTEERRVEAKRALAALAGENGAAADYSLQQSQLAVLERQASLGDESAKLKADQIKLTIEQATAIAKLNEVMAENEKAQLAGGEAANQARERVVAAREQIKQLQDSNGQQTDKSQQDSAAFLLQQESSLGDKVAERMLKKIELEKQFAAERAKALAVLKEDASTQAQRDKARALLSSLDAVQKRAESQLGGVDRQPGGASLVDEHYLTGRTASINQERDQYQPIVDAQNANKTVNENMAGLLKDILSALQSGGRAKKLT